MTKARLRCLNQQTVARLRRIRADVWASGARFERPDRSSAKIFAARPKLCQNKRNIWGWPVSFYPKALLIPASLLAVCVFTFSPASSTAQVAHGEQVQITPPLLRMIDPPSADATVDDLQKQADQLRARNCISTRWITIAQRSRRNRSRPHC